ncbi:MAG: flagellar biosynthesis protein FlhF [Burkholderiales bacterium]|nr:flagellar biosynthesis protein FlhF [Burkholderiales bacterium]
MMMRKFVAPTAREAMQKMKAELGADALVISNRKTPAGIEIMAMLEGEAEAPLPLAQPAAPQPAALRGARAHAIEQYRFSEAGAARAPAQAPRMTAHAAHAAAAPPAVPTARTFASLEEFARRHAPPSAPASAPVAPAPAAAPIAAAQVTAPAPASNPFRAVEAARPSPAAGDSRVLAELAMLKDMLQTQMASMAWRDMTGRRPLALSIWREMIDAGFSAGLARTVAERLPDDVSEAEARRWLAGVLAKNLRCSDPAQDAFERGGVFALVGPTGVGKTTTTAKLAARCVVRHGAQALGLITTDSYRIGAFDQLAIYGKILGVPVHSAQSYAELNAHIETLATKRLVLIDSTGMGQRDTRLPEQINLLNHPRIRRVLLLNAAAQAETLDDVARAYRGQAAGAPPLAGVILTKLDEAARLGPGLDVIARHGLELMCVTNGQRVPEDLHGPAGAALVQRALKSGADPQFALRDDEAHARAFQSMAA